MKNLEKFILDHREAFDSEVPDLKVWAKIEHNLPKETLPKLSVETNQKAKVVALWDYLPSLRVAASVAMILAVGVAIGFYMKSNITPPSLADVSPEYGEMENYYQREIAKKEKKLMQVSQKAPQVQQDLAAIDQVMMELRQELYNAPKGSREQIIRTMIESYKNKTDILERVLKESEQHSINHNAKPDFNNEKDTI